MIDVSVIVVSYNTAGLTCAAIDSIFKQTKKYAFEILVVDNNSSDDSTTLIKDRFPEVSLIELSENIGFAGANNLAAKQAKGRYVLLLNPDTVVLDEAIDKLVSWADCNSDMGIYGGSNYFGDMSRNPTAGWNMSSIWSLFCTGIGLSSVFRSSKIFNPESLASWSWNEPRIVDIVTGCFMLLRTEHWEKLTGFDLQFKMYGEDADICLRSAAMGKPCVLVPDAGIIHYGGASEKVRAEKLVRLLKAKVQLFRKHWKGPKVVYAILMLKLWAFSRMTVLFLISRAKKSSFLSYDSWRTVWKKRKEWETT